MDAHYRRLAPPNIQHVIYEISRLWNCLRGFS